MNALKERVSLGSDEAGDKPMRAELSPELGQKLSDEGRNALILQNLSLVNLVVCRLAQKLPLSVDRDELYSAGVLGLVRAAEKFDSSRTARFRTYAETRVRGAVLDYLRSLSWAPRGLHKKARELSETRAALEQKMLRGTTETELASAMGMDSKTYNKLVDKLQRIEIQAVDELGGDPINPNPRTMRAAAQEPDQLPRLERKELLEFIARSLETLPERLKRVLWLYYCEELNLKEVGAVLGVNEARASQLHSKALAALKEEVNARMSAIGRRTEAARQHQIPRARASRGSLRPAADSRS